MLYTRCECEYIAIFFKQKRWISVCLLALGAPIAARAAPAANDHPTPSEAAIEDVIVTGTREYGINARQSSSPITIISSGKLKETGQTNILDALLRLAPSYNANAVNFDLSALVRSPRLRGLTANHVLVLVNGKRRHGTAVISTGGFPKGSAGADLDLIPVSAVDHIEILEDGAAAQYGSDAIAGVVNIILKNSPDEGEIDAVIGRYGKSYNPNSLGDGFTRNVQIDKGFDLDGRGFVHLSGELTSHLHSNQTGSDQNVFQDGLRVGPGTPYPWIDPNVAAVIGDPKYLLPLLGVNSGLELDNGIELYAFGTGGTRVAESFQNYRAPDFNGTSPNTVIYPNGFVPAEKISEYDWSGTIGSKGVFLGDGRWDVSLTYGGDNIDVGLNSSANRTLFNDTLATRGAGWTPTSFYIGQYSNTQRTINVDFIKPFSLSIAPEPINVAIGAENRRETYQIKQGDFWSYYSAGPAAFAGIRPTDAGSHGRDVYAGYVDVSTKLLPNWKVDVAGRYENYSDFGGTLNGKLSTRFDFTRELAVRGTLSTGFRAPTLAEEYFSQSAVSPTSAYVILPPNSNAAAIAGARSLRPEKSTNISVGLVTEITPGLHGSVDLYQIDIRDRIVSTGALTGPAAIAAITASGNVIDPTANATASYFLNGADTRTRGVDIKADYAVDFDQYGALRYDFAASFNSTSILGVRESPAAFNGAPLLDPVARSNITDWVPHTKIILGATYLKDAWTFTLRLTRYGTVSAVSATPTTDTAPYYTNVITPKLITDAEIGYDFGIGLHAAIGANNLFAVRPNETLLSTRVFNTTVFPTFSPFGVNGGYYYARMAYKF
ncbi:TonB-dependent siderophore receptor [Methylosinus sp. H3A]|uniref:TonB-dependent receptor plug domain-containing protein n=1 Tax=Methylosinus sp. H3A TaxID=2785786 RepID=UPI0024860387|nr:TonB-dependent receptor [Methylosinus sp. H3A]